MTFVAGRKLRAGELNQISPNAVEGVANPGGGFQAITTTAVDLAGATVTITTAVINTAVVVSGVFDVDSNGSTDVMVGRLDIAGVTQSGEAHYQGTGRATVTQTWRSTFAAIGSYTLKLRVLKVNNANVQNCYGTHSKIIVQGPGIT